MRIADLQDSLRAHIWARIHRGELTGSALSRDAGFQQAHMSNFLNARRGLSPEAMDRLLDVLELDVLDLADPEELRLRALQRPERASSFDSVPLVSLHDAAFAPNVPPRQARDSLKFRKRFLQRLKPDTIGERGDWLRFVLVKADASNSSAMAPRLAPGAVLLLDRHYNSLRPYQQGPPNIYAVRAGTERYSAAAQSGLAGRVMEIAHGNALPDYIAGRVCHTAVDL